MDRVLVAASAYRLQRRFVVLMRVFQPSRESGTPWKPAKTDHNMLWWHPTGVVASGKSAAGCSESEPLAAALREGHLPSHLPFARAADVGSLEGAAEEGLTA